jgi:hypothetical protein
MTQYIETEEHDVSEHHDQAIPPASSFGYSICSMDSAPFAQSLVVARNTIMSAPYAMAGNTARSNLQLLCLPYHRTRQGQTLPRNPRYESHQGQAYRIEEAQDNDAAAGSTER